MVHETLEQYIKLQELDTLIFNIEKKLDLIPGLLKESLVKYETAVEEKTKLHEQFVDLKGQILKIEANLASQKKLLENSQKKLASVKNSKEYEAALKELDILKKKITDDSLQLDILNSDAKKIGDLCNEHASRVENLEKEYIQEKNDKEYENRALFDELDLLKKQRIEYVSSMKNSVFSKYEKIRNARDNIAVVPLEKDTCCGCFMKLTPQMVVNIKKDLDIYQCPYCQRFIFYKKTEDNKEDK